jgi:hypothetical protein
MLCLFSSLLDRLDSIGFSPQTHPDIKINTIYKTICRRPRFYPRHTFCACLICLLKIKIHKNNTTVLSPRLKTMDIIYVNCDFCITSSLLNTHTHRYTQYNNLPHGQPLFVGWKINVPARANTHINTLASPPLLSSFVSHKHSFTHLSASPCFFVMFH